MSWNIAELPWLPPAPVDFRQRCRALAQSASATGADLLALAKYNLTSDDLHSLSRALDKLRACNDRLPPLWPTKVGILANGTTQLWIPALIGSAVRYSVVLNVVSTEYDQALQEAANPDSAINASRPDAVVMALDYRGLPWGETAPGDEAAATRALDQVIGFYRTIREGVAAGSGAVTIWQTLAVPPEPLFGSLDRSVAGTKRWLIDRVNAWMVTEALARGDCLFDVAALAERVGSDAWFDPVQWNAHKLPFSQRLVPLYTDHLARVLGALRGHARKCLVLDLDNTLWGGVIGDDGLEGIRVGQGSGEGEAFVEIQRYALELRRRGIILAVSSKNEDDNARLPFRSHPDMVMREADFACFRANWSDKASNLEQIAHSLDVGVDSLVLLDDNPAERAQVRAALPAVAVPEVPADPSFFVRALASAGYFESIAFVPEDRARADQYSANANRVSAMAASRDLKEFLASLEMHAVLSPFDGLGRPRIAQLINKSNQFNLTTRRYTEAEVAELEKDSSVFTLQVRLRDRFGDNGMISVVVCRKQAAAWEIDTWLMSCRVLGRKVEELVLDEIVRAARAANAVTIIGRFIPTKKNELVRDHYRKLGFAQQTETLAETTWALDVAGYQPPDLPFKIERAGGLEHAA